MTEHDFEHELQQAEEEARVAAEKAACSPVKCLAEFIVAAVAQVFSDDLVATSREDLTFEAQLLAQRLLRALERSGNPEALEVEGDVRALLGRLLLPRRGRLIARRIQDWLTGFLRGSWEDQ